MEKGDPDTMNFFGWGRNTIPRGVVGVIMRSLRDRGGKEKGNGPRFSPKKKEGAFSLLVTESFFSFLTGVRRLGEKKKRSTAHF